MFFVTIVRFDTYLLSIVGYVREVAARFWCIAICYQSSNALQLRLEDTISLPGGIYYT